jgi:hypothetical protein
MADTFSQEASAQLRFGGGVHSRASEDDIDIRECARGENFELDTENQEWRKRAAFDRIGTAPNGQEIRGFISLQKSNGDVHYAVQAGPTVYEWDGLNTFTFMATVPANARLRGHLEHNWQLDDKVIVTDLELAAPVYEWDGVTTFRAVNFEKEVGGGVDNFGEFRAKYCYVSKERVVYANIHENGENFPHMMVGSKRGDYHIISVTERPSSSMSDEDAFFLIQPDYRPINGLVESFGAVVTSSEAGSLFILTGEGASDFQFSELFPRSGARGDESLVWAGNDIFYGRQGRLESVAATEKFGDVSSANISEQVSDQLETFSDWAAVYNSRNNRVYFFPKGKEQVWVYFKSVADRGVQGNAISPWVKWTTTHPSRLDASAAMNMLDPQDGLEYVFWGDAEGNIYRMEGSAIGGDGGTEPITSFRLSRLIVMPLDAESYNISGYVRWRRDQEHTLNLRIEYAGRSIFNHDVQVPLPAAEGAIYYGGPNHYGGGAYYGTQFEGRLARTIFPAAGHSNEFQIRATIEGTSGFQISEIGLRLTAAA